MEDVPLRTSLQHPCRDCGADLAFKPGTNHLVCPYCGAENEIVVSAGTLDEQNLQATLARLAGEADTDEVFTATCANCAAQTTLPPNVTAAGCAFCGAPVDVSAHSTRRLRPQALAPFAVDERAAREAFGQWLAGLWFAPNAVKRIANGAGPLVGVYVPHWTFDATTTTAYTGRRGDAHLVQRRGPDGKMRTHREIRWHGVSGTVHVGFDDLVVPASSTLPSAYRPSARRDAVEALVPYTEAYLAGFRAESYTVSLEAGYAQAQEAMQGVIDQRIRQDIGGDQQEIRSKQTDYANVSFKHILLPLWLSAFEFRGKPFRFTVDARTGEVHGERPWSVVKIVFAVLAVLLIIGLIASLSSGG